MDSYDSGVILGQIIFWLLFFGMAYGIYRLWKSIFSGLFKNKTQKILQTYLFWSEFAHDITSMDEFIKKLEKIKSKIVYKDEWGQFYLTEDEGTVHGKKVERYNIGIVVNSNVHRIFFMKRLERITLYSKKDLKKITKDSQMVWIVIKDIFIHMILQDDKFIYPDDYPQDNKYRFGYTTVYDKNKNIGVYDIENEKLVLPFKYKYIATLGNIIEVSKDYETYEIFNLETNEILQINDTKTFPNISQEYKEKINLNKIELTDYMNLFDTPKNQKDLAVMKLWRARVGVMQVPEQYESIIEDCTKGIREWNQYCSADIYDMSVELPVNFKKTNLEYVSLGISIKYLILEDRQKL